MSYWTYIHGVVTVDPMGRTWRENKNVLMRILKHLPTVSGSERNMKVCALIDRDAQDPCGGYINLVVQGSLRDRELIQTLKSFNNWLCRLSKRIPVVDVTVKLSDSWRSIFIEDTNHVYGDMFDYKSFHKNKNHGLFLKSNRRKN